MWHMIPQKSGDLSRAEYSRQRAGRHDAGGSLKNLPELLVTQTARTLSKPFVRFAEAGLAAPPHPKQADSPMMLYLHVPFCEELCTYCSFHRVKLQPDLAKAYFAALRKELELYAHRKEFVFHSLYVGGGTPTVLPDELVSTLELAKSLFPIREISVETNPNHLTAENLLKLKQAGVDRLSVGVQTFDDGILRVTGRYGRYGSGEETIARLQAARGVFRTLNVDMIFNYPDQTEAGLQRDLEQLLKLKLDQITFYPLMLATSTRSKIERTMGSVSDARSRILYEQVVAALKKQYRQSTAWCFTRESSMIDEYIVNNDEYAGVGSGAFGYLNGCVYANTFDIGEYIRQVDSGRFAIAAHRCYGSTARLMYDFMMQLFAMRIDVCRLRQKYGIAYWQLYPALLFLRGIGAIRQCGPSGEYLTTKPYFGVIMMREFFTAVNNFRDYCRKAAGY